MTRIDVHHHFLPRIWLDEMARHPEQPPMPQDWSVDADLAAMDALGITTSILSVTSPGVWFGDAEQARRLARETNDEAASLVDAHPGRYGLLASLPLPDVDAAVAEVKRALDDLHADGVALMTSAGGTYVGDERVEPLWQVLDEREAVVFVHPTESEGHAANSGSTPGVDAWVEFPAETTRMASELVLRGVLHRYPRVKVILAHAGGFLPFQTGRFEALSTIIPGLDADQVKRDLRSFWFDTALSTAPATLNALLEHAPHDHVLFGTDFPACPLPLALGFAHGLDTWASDDAPLLRRIDSENALHLFPRLAQQA